MKNPSPQIRILAHCVSFNRDFFQIFTPGRLIETKFCPNVMAQSAPSLVKIELTDLATHYNFEKGPFTFKSREILLKKRKPQAMQKGLTHRIHS